MAVLGALLVVGTLVIAGATVLILQRRLSKSLATVIDAMNKAVEGQAEMALPDGGTKEMDAMVSATRALQTATRDSAALLRELAPVLEAAQAGDFITRLAVDRGDVAVPRMVNDLLASVETGLNATVLVFGRLADGDLTVRMDGNFSGAFAELKSNADRTAHSLNAALSGISDGAAEIDAQAVQLDAASNDLADRTQSNAAILEETSASVRMIGQFPERHRRSNLNCTKTDTISAGPGQRRQARRKRSRREHG